MSEMDPRTIARWRELGLSDAEIGRRLGVSAERMREDADLDDVVGQDDNAPNATEAR